MEIDVTPEINCENDITGEATEDESINSMENNSACSIDTAKEYSANYHSNSHSKKVIKHALRQQAKRRRKNTTIAAGNSAPVPRIIVKPLPPQPSEEVNPVAVKTPTMREVLASIPGFSIKPRKRSNKKLSTAAQLEQTKEGCIDLETSDSILVHTNLRALLNKYTFSALPPFYQYKLVQLLPVVDRQGTSAQSDVSCRLSTSGLNNEFFARACLEWQERLGEGEFTPENQQKLKSEAEKERSRLDPWKLKHFEPIWGDKQQGQSDTSCASSILLSNASRPPIKTTIKLRPTTTINNRTKATPPVPKRLRTVGAMTRSITSYKEEIQEETPQRTSMPVPDLLPIKSESPLSNKPESPSPNKPEASTDSNDSVPYNEIETETELYPSDSSQNAKLTVTVDINDSEETIINEETIASCIIESIIESPSNRLEKRPRSRSNRPEKRLRPRSNSPDIEETSPQIKRLSPCSDETAESLNEHQIDEEAETEEELEKEQQPLDDRLDDAMKYDAKECIMQMHEDASTEADANDGSKVEGDSNDSQSTDEKCDMINYDDVKQLGSNETDDDNSQDYDVKSSQEEDLSSFKDEITSEFIEAMDQQSQHSDHEEIEEHFGVLPSSLILQQESIMMDKSFTESCETNSCHGESVEKLEAAVEEADLVIAQLSDDVAFDQRVGTITESEEDANEDRFIDAENFVLESGAISLSASQKLDSNKEDGDEEEIRGVVQLFAAAVAAREDCCWDVVDSSTEKLLDLEVPLHALDSVNVGMVAASETTDDVKVIPMQEELEVRLEQGTFPVPTDWSYDVKMDSDMVAAALGSAETQPETQPGVQFHHHHHHHQEYAQGNQVKIELEVTLTPEITNADSLVTSTVVGVTNGMGTSTSTSVTSSALSKTITTVIPPTTIVCLPSVVSTSSLHNSGQVSHLTPSAPSLPRHGMVASSSALPYLALSTSQPIRAVPAHSKTKPKTKDSQVSSGSGSSNRNRSSNKPPPGAVNLERSYQICQAVIQNSPNRDQLRCQLKPPPSLLAATPSSSASTVKKPDSNRQTQYGVVTSSRSSGNNGSKTFTPPLPASANFQMVAGSNGIKQLGTGNSKPVNVARNLPYQQQRQQSPPVVVRHVFTSSQGIPVTMAVLPQAQAAVSPEVSE